MVYVAQEAQRTEAHQNSRNIALTHEARCSRASIGDLCRRCEVFTRSYGRTDEPRRYFLHVSTRVERLEARKVRGGVCEPASTGVPFEVSRALVGIIDDRLSVL